MILLDKFDFIVYDYFCCYLCYRQRFLKLSILNKHKIAFPLTVLTVLQLLMVLFKVLVYWESFTKALTVQPANIFHVNLKVIISQI